MTRLSAHFSLDQLIASEVAARSGIDNTPPEPVLANLRRLAQLLEEVRAALGGEAIDVSSGYRSAELNRLVGGSAASAHLDGRAADFVAPGYGPPYDIAKRLVD